MHAFDNDYEPGENMRFLSRLERFGKAYRELKELYKALDIDDSGIKEIFNKIDEKVELLVYTMADEIINDFRPMYVKKYLRLKGKESESDLTADDIKAINRELVKRYDWFLEKSGMGYKGEKIIRHNP